MGMVYHPQRTFHTTRALYFSADHTLGLLLERSKVGLYYTSVSSLYIYTGNSAASATLFCI